MIDNGKGKTVADCSSGTGEEVLVLETDSSDVISSTDQEEIRSASDRSRSHSVESILTAKSFARNIPGLVQSLSDQEKTLPLNGSLIKCITQRILDEVMPKPTAQRPAYLEHSIQLVVPGSVRSSESKKRYMVIMVGSHLDPSYDEEEAHEHVILGINISNNLPDNVTPCPNHTESPNGCQGDITVAMALPVTKGVTIEMDGDGGIKIKASQNTVQYIFKPVNLQALWVAHSYLNSDIENARRFNFFPGSRNHHTWAGCYTNMVPDYLESEDEWEDNSQIENQVTKHDFRDDKIKKLMEKILFRIREIIMMIDLDNASCYEIRKQLETEFGVNLTPYKRFIDEQIVKVFGQSTEPPSKIFDYLYLGNEWNASNLTQLRQLGVTHVLNVTMEIANFFSHELVYKTIRIKDNESQYLQQYWDDTYNFVQNAKRQNKKVFVHCRMGVSRSAACVIAYIMKEYSMNISVAQAYVKKIRCCVNPNPGFQKQLEEYNGILEARYNNTYGIMAKRRQARCPQISEQKLITERWLKEYGHQEDDNLSTGPVCEKEESEYSVMVREIDGYEKVSEWMERNDVSSPGCCEYPVSPLLDLDHRVLQHDLLLQLKKGEDSATLSDPLNLSQSMSECSRLTGFNTHMNNSMSRADVITAHDNTTSDKCTSPETMTTLNCISPTQQTNIPDTTGPSQEERRQSAPHDTRDHVTGDQLSADGPYSPADLEQEVETVTGGVVRDCEIQSRVKEAVVHRIKSNPSFRRSTVSGVVRSCVLQIEVRNEAENYYAVEKTRDRVRSAGSASAGSASAGSVSTGGTGNSKRERTRKIKQTQSWADYTSANNLGSDTKHPRKQKKDHTKFRQGGQKICASIKKIIERLLSPARPDKQTNKLSVNEEIECVAEREGKVYDKNYRMSMPIISRDYHAVVPKRRCQSGADFIPPNVIMDKSIESCI